MGPARFSGVPKGGSHLPGRARGAAGLHALLPGQAWGCRSQRARCFCVAVEAFDEDCHDVDVCCTTWFLNFGNLL